MKRTLLLISAGLLPLIALAYDVKINGIFYNFTPNEAEVTSSNDNTTNYSGSVVIPESVTYGGKTYSVTSIGNSAFGNCSGLTSVRIPESVTNINNGAFQGCRVLNSVIIPKNVTVIDQNVFMNCSNLRTVSIPEGVTSIGIAAFYECSSLTDVYCYAAEPPGVRSMFEDEAWDGYPFDQYYIKEHTTLHVPAGSLEKYKTALRWSDFWKIVPITGTSVKDIPFSGKSNYFDLQGRKFQGKPARGIYIGNGQKILIK